MTRLLGVCGFMAASLLALPVSASASDGDPLSASRWKQRVLLVMAVQPGDPKLMRQRQIFRTMGAGARERDLRLVEVVGDTPRAAELRRRFDIDGLAFHAILVGKDGGNKLTSDVPLDADTLFPLIDTMPMRQEEMRGGRS
ncbi:DUF4174 domain-containing protein [Lichenifustis flavocetrariae]|uniref:DUF4174 domain-containing protein n=1 Tax=Lichenifustis flavocetrariae TaxID=2949735 RepID=A0AA41YUA1_9HYPH|nr:DUF4174 domain-containing protein [Lichenifustis flavocetrariae]MCW6507361.1 DUF4174 domain-containing protein [Lichenifustis flavocetrariae]